MILIKKTIRLRVYKVYNKMEYINKNQKTKNNVTQEFSKYSEDYVP